MERNRVYLEGGEVYLGDCLEIMSSIPDKSIDLILTDPPYGIGFMGKDWDRALPDKRIWSECYRVLKDGAFSFVMSIPRADCLSRMIISLEDAGFRVNFTPIFWAYASGFPKAQNIGKAIDKRLGAERKIIGKYSRVTQGDSGRYNWHNTEQVGGTSVNITKPATPQAKALDGSYGGFQPKPAVEVIIVAMKPLSEKTYVDQALKNRKGITWLDDGRIPTAENLNGGMYSGKGKAKTVADHQWGFQKRDGQYIQPMGRFPANLLVSDDVLNDGRMQKSGIAIRHNIGHSSKGNIPFAQGSRGNEMREDVGYGDSGSFSRYFDLDKWFSERIKFLPQSVQKTFPFLIVPKASKSEKGKDCNHPTVKPLKLMSYLITLGSREGDLVLDPFMGSGTTGIACKLLNRDFIGCEINKEYLEIAQKRIGSIFI